MAKLPPKPRKIKGLSREQLLNLDKEELVDKILQLEAHTNQLKNIISKSQSDIGTSEKPKGQRQFDFRKCHYRRVLLRILYFGWDYQGLATQEDTNQTIEHHLFQALSKSCLIESRETSNYHRCGRTDKGVSSFGQAISITLRSKLPPAEHTKESVSKEILYCKILNRLLPKEIRAVAWLPIPEDKVDFSARFDCTKRTYKYYFPRSNLNIPAMKLACSHLIGSHDFRHLCKMDVGNGVVEFIRKVFNVDILSVDENDCDKPTSIYYLLIEGNAFLWHQIRCIMGVLLLIGQNKEEHTVITDLLDIENHPRKPQYNMALDIPLNLFNCQYGLYENEWVYDIEELECLIRHLQNEWTIQSIKSTMIVDCLKQLEDQYRNQRRKGTANTKSGCENEKGDTEDNELERDSTMYENQCRKGTTDIIADCENERGNTKDNDIERDSIMSHTDCLLQGVKPKAYTPLLKRDTCSTLDERIEYYRKKRKIDCSGAENS